MQSVTRMGDSVLETCHTERLGPIDAPLQLVIISCLQYLHPTLELLYSSSNYIIIGYGTGKGPTPGTVLIPVLGK